MSTQLYNKSGQYLYPNGIATSIAMLGTTYQNKTVQDCITNIYEELAKLSGTEEQKKLLIEVKYFATTISNESDLKAAMDAGDVLWDENFILPNSDRPYVWKYTSFKANMGDTEPVEVYEIIAADTSEKTQTIYIAPNTSSEVSITYPMTLDPDGNPVLDFNIYNADSFIPQGGWSPIPISISPESPQVYMATRTKRLGVWSEYNGPVCFGKWAFDSILIIKYAVTEGLSSTAPELNATNTSPGENWSDEVPELASDFQGKIWMITATQVNSLLSATDGVFWKGPNLISIIK